MSYDYFLWRTNRIVRPKEINENTVQSWTDPDRLRATLNDLCPTLNWNIDGLTADDCSGESSIRAVRLPDPGKDKDPLVIRASRHADGTKDLIRLGKELGCLVYDAQTGEILYQPESPPD